MFQLPDYFYDLTTFSIALRLLLALVIGGVIGLERGINKHTAGFRTHVLVCVGAALAMLTNQYITQTWDVGSDPARMGAQVITGVGFLGVGTILVTSRNRIRGLTTAAGLWASACLGLAIGIGFYEGAVIGAVLIFISLALLPKIEYFFMKHSNVLNLYVEMDHRENYKAFQRRLKEMEILVVESGDLQPSPLAPEGITVMMSLKLPKNMNDKKVMEELAALEGIELVEEL
ncbi:MAG: MgtC/SapB family protein [Anaerovoracaceae bacterium]|jgi:putative Mg2+ transporter-C (MgtC) family protein